MTASPFDDIRALLADLRQPRPATPDPALGQLGEIAAWVRTWRGAQPIGRPIIALYAGSGGADPQGVRGQLEAIAAGGAAVAALAQAQGAGLEAFDLAIDRPVGDMAAAAAMGERECAATMAFGMEALAKQPDLLVLAALDDDGGEAAEAIARALGGEAAGGRVGAALARVRAGGVADPLDLLRELGDRPIAAIAGAIVAARTQGVPVLLDGAAALAAAAVLQALRPGALDHCRAAHGGGPKQARLAERLGLRPLLDLGLVAGGGVGGAAALALVKLAAALGPATIEAPAPKRELPRPRPLGQIR